MKEYKEYAVYKGDEIVAIGSVKEIAEQLNVKETSVYFWKSPANHKRNENPRGCRKVAYVIEEDELDV